MKQEKPLQYVFMPPIETRETEELIGIAYSDPGAWQPRAVELANAELDRRGVTSEQRMTVLLRWKAQAEAAEREYRAWLDGVEQKYVEEVGSMNMMFAYGNKIVTPALNGSILPGITRNSVLTLAGQLGYEVEEKRLAIADIFDDIKSGKLTEAFGTGTAAVISPVGELCWKGEKLTVGDGQIGQVSQKLYDTLTGIQYGKLPDENHWIVKI